MPNKNEVYPYVFLRGAIWEDKLYISRGKAYGISNIIEKLYSYLVPAKYPHTNKTHKK